MHAPEGDHSFYFAQGLVPCEDRTAALNQGDAEQAPGQGAPPDAGKRRFSAMLTAVSPGYVPDTHRP